METKEAQDLERRMQGAVGKLRDELVAIRAGRASAAMLDAVQVDVYGQSMPIAQLASINVPEPRLITIQVWDKDQVAHVEKAIRTSDMGFNPAVDGNLVRIPIPPLNEERRREVSKLAAKYAEQARIAIRHVRRDGIDKIKKSDAGRDEIHAGEKRIQDMTDRMIGDIDKALATKEREIMQA